MDSLLLRAVVTRALMLATIALSCAVVFVRADTSEIETFKFTHPGVLVGRDTLKFVRSKIATGRQPWKAAFDLAVNHEYGDLARVPKPWSTVECGPWNEPDFGCSDERDDSNSAYTLSLLWYYTRNIAYATKAREIMNAWSAKLRLHTNGNAKLVAAWSATMFARAAEIIRYTTPRGFWSSRAISRFETMLRRRYYPLIKNGQMSQGAGNWDLAMADGLISMGVFLNDVAMYKLGIGLWNRRVPSYFYLPSDGTSPKKPPEATYFPSKFNMETYWHNPSKYVRGLCSETCRDVVHAQLGLMSTINSAETVRLQGGDLYGSQRARLAAAVEFHSKYFLPENQHYLLDTFCPLPGPSFWGATCPQGIKSCGTFQTFEIAYSHFAQRLKMKMPYTKAFLDQVRPISISPWNNVIGVFETLSHASTGFA